MAIPSFYHSSLAQQDQLISLDANESSHAIKSRRLGIGQQVRIFNGRGMVGAGVLSAMDRRQVTVELTSVEQLPRPARSISIAVAVPKGDRQKVMVDMLTQLGVFEIITLRCQRSVTKLSQTAFEKWSKVAIEACKQSQNPWLPIIIEETSLDDLLDFGDRRFVLANADGASPQDLLGDSGSVTALIGPEGGFSEQELTKLNKLSIPSMRIGPYILRTEAAAVAAVSALLG